MAAIKESNHPGFLRVPERTQEPASLQEPTGGMVRKCDTGAGRSARIYNYIYGTVLKISRGEGGIRLHFVPHSFPERGQSNGGPYIPHDRVTRSKKKRWVSIGGKIVSPYLQSSLLREWMWGGGLFFKARARTERGYGWGGRQIRRMMFPT